jgi:hypothetical protein
MRVAPLVAVFLLLAACVADFPEAECDTNPEFVGSALTCDDAVRAAVAALPTDHPAIERVQFLFGSPVPVLGRLFPADGEQPIEAYVVFTYRGATDQQYVPVVWYAGELTSGEPAAY